METSFLPDNLEHNVKHSVFNIDKTKKVTFHVICLVAFFLFFHLFFLSAPTDFPTGAIVKIEKGNSLRNVSLKLKDGQIIRSRLVFEAFVIIFGREKHIISSDYYFENKLPVYEIARRIVKGERHIAPIAVTIPEGFDVVQIADTFVSKLSNFNKDKFLAEAKALEGYLFPDTYFFFSTDTEADIIRSMRENFEKKIAPFRSDIALSRRTEREIIIMASIIEREAKENVDRKFISGILWKRISIGMPLQVDVAVETYKTKGLPKSPISNPGIESIKAAIHPENSPYLFFIYDKNDGIHYGRSFAEHRQNVLKYLK
ncbi:endolytic transglycosylase MltG [Candidatus Nomurabacteria bacterium]|nr:endolytic transglycosylase MltG [Candidatus Nomurabacteria bacterium]